MAPFVFGDEDTVMPHLQEVGEASPAWATFWGFTRALCVHTFSSFSFVLLLLLLSGLRAVNRWERKEEQEEVPSKCLLWPMISILPLAFTFSCRLSVSHSLRHRRRMLVTIHMPEER